MSVEAAAAASSSASSVDDADADSDVGRDSVDKSTALAAANTALLKSAGIEDIEEEVREVASVGAIRRIVRLSSSEHQHQHQHHLVADEAEVGSDVSSSAEEQQQQQQRVEEVGRLSESDLPEPEEEPTLSAAWRREQRHFFIMSRSGKPIFSRHGNEEKLVTHMGVMTALVSVVEDLDDQLHSFVSGDRRFVFLVKEPLLLVGVSAFGDSSSQLLLQLNYLYNQILSLLTCTVLQKVFRKPSYDLRHLLPDGDRILNNLIGFMESDLGPLLGAVQCLPLPKATRDAVGAAVASGARVKDLVFGILLSGTRLVSLVHMKKQYLHPLDMHVVINLISSTESFKSSESWTPICLPKFDASGNLYAYVCFIDTNLCLVLLTVDNTSFDLLSEAKAKIVEKLHKHNCFAEIRISAEAVAAAAAAAVAADAPAGDADFGQKTAADDMRHFVYKIRAAGQYHSPAVSPPLNDAEGRRRLLAIYYRMHCLLHRRSRPLKLVYHTNSDASVMAWVTQEFELYAAFSPLIPKRAAIQSVNKTLRWLSKERDRLFCLSSPTF